MVHPLWNCNGRSLIDPAVWRAHRSISPHGFHSDGLSSSSSGCIHSDGWDGGSSRAPLERRRSGSFCQNLPQSVWEQELQQLSSSGRQRLSGSKVGGEADCAAGRLAQGGTEYYSSVDTIDYKINKPTYWYGITFCGCCCRTTVFLLTLNKLEKF